MIGDHSLNPAYVLILGALLIPLVKGVLRKLLLLALPVGAAAVLLQLPHGQYNTIRFAGYLLQTLRLDALSFVFALIFIVAAFLLALYALRVEDTLQHVAGFLYAGSAIGAVLAGDLITLFIYWEITAVSSVFLIWARRTEAAYRAGMRYVLIQVGSGLLLLSGIILMGLQSRSLAFNHFELNSPAAWLLFIAFGIKCAFPLLHTWLKDAYPEATVTGAVALSAFTTKLAVYALARGFAGTDILIWIGAAMTAFPIFFIIVENDLRRVLAYSLVNQLGFMVVGIGIGTELAINGAAAHAFCHILYKGLLFMTMGAVLLRTGTAKVTELGGLGRAMPLTALCCIIGSASISAVPLFSGFISKGMILTAVGEEHLSAIFLVLLFAAAGEFAYSGIKVPYTAFFARSRKQREVKEAPANMLWAMGLASALCLAVGIYPQPLYNILPFEVDFAPYTAAHVITQLQLLAFGALAFITVKATGLYPVEQDRVILDADWLYRRAGKKTGTVLLAALMRLFRLFEHSAAAMLHTLDHLIAKQIDPASYWSRSKTIGNMTFWVAFLLALILIFSYL